MKWAGPRGVHLAMAGEGTRSAGLAIGAREAQWVAKLLRIPAEPVLESIESSKAINQKASTCLPLSLGDGRFLFLKKGSAEHLDEKRRWRTGKSLSAEHAFYTRALPCLSWGSAGLPLVPRCLGSWTSRTGDLELASESQRLGEELGIEGELLLLLEDARHVADGEVLGQVGPSPGGMTSSQARAAVRWLARFHKTFSGSPSQDLDVWPQGGYWSYAKRVVVSKGAGQKLPVDTTSRRIGEEWEGLVERLGDSAPELRDVRVFGLPFDEALGESAGSLSRILARGCLEEHRRCLLHGDYKAANIFVGEDGDSATAVDFQWSGWGLPGVDLAYFLCTSLDESALGEVDELASVYFEEFGGESGSFSFELDVSIADYVRYLVADMWSNLDSEKIDENRLCSNVGRHKRSLKHLTKVVMLGARSLENLYGNAGEASTRRTLARLFTCVVKLAQMAGDIVAASWAGRGTIGVTNKGYEGDFDPQTEADVAAERLIVGVLSQLFPEIMLIGEEGESSDRDEENVENALRELDGALKDIAPWEIQLPHKVDLKRDVTVWIDPLDGTKEFLRGDQQGVTTLIGVAIAGTPVFGAVCSPFSERGRTVWGGLGGGGAYEQGREEVMGTARPLLPPPSPRRDGVKRIVTTRSHGNAAIEEAAKELGGETLKLGGAGRKILMLLDGTADSYVFPSKGTKRWDTCAGEALLLALGGKLLKATDGTQYSYDAESAKDPYNDEGLVASIHDLEDSCRACRKAKL